MLSAISNPVFVEVKPVEEFIAPEQSHKIVVTAQNAIIYLPAYYPSKSWFWH